MNKKHIGGWVLFFAGSVCLCAGTITAEPSTKDNQGHYYGCDFSVCDWNLEILNSSYGHDLALNALVISPLLCNYTKKNSFSS